MLRTNFPNNDDEAKEYGGFMRDENSFCRLFDFRNSLEETLKEVNSFLFENGYRKVVPHEFDNDFRYENEELSLSLHGYKEELVLFIENPDRVFHLSRVLEKLTEFRDQRDWEQFHNSKDLAIAISLEASELVQLFLWKDNEDFNIEDLEDELADVLSFCFLLAEKHSINIPEIVLKKIAKNALKYPVSKAKGTAKKYTDL